MVRPLASGGGKVDLTKVGLNSIPEGVVKNNLKGISPQMDKKGWVDSQGRKGKVRATQQGVHLMLQCCSAVRAARAAEQLQHQQ